MDSKTVHASRQDLQILDVREDEEWAAGRIDGAVHIPLGQLERRVDELDRDRPVVTVCRGGGRAAQAAELLCSAGLSAEVMDGGMMKWAEDQQPFSTPDGRPGHIA
jgi:rhodanese-related sulfurtransferase